MLFRLIPVFVSALFSFSAAHAACDFEKLVAGKGSENSAVFKAGKGLSLVIEGADNALNAFEGPARIETNGAKKCDIAGGIFSSVYFSKSKQLLLLEEYSGSCGSHRIINPKNCKQVGKTAEHCGSVTVEKSQLRNDPPCEPLSDDGKLGSCSSGKIFRLSAKTCELSLDTAASKKWTREKLGVDLPLDGKAYRVSGIGTAKAKIEAE